MTPLITALYHFHASFAKLWNTLLHLACPNIYRAIRSYLTFNMGSGKLGRVRPNLYSLLKNWLETLILLDFSKAFDRVNHQKFMFKLHQHGVRGHTLSWIKAFLIGCSQTVVLEGKSSSEISHQGSVFLLYINTLPENIHSQVCLFGDDTAV